MEIRLRRAYDPPAADDGHRVLVDRIWPRGRSRAVLVLDAWYRELGPSDVLRKWFGHDPARWPEFRRRYRTELARPEVQRLLDDLAAMARTETLTLVYGAADREHNQAVVLAELIRERSSDGVDGGRPSSAPGKRPRSGPHGSNFSTSQDFPARECQEDRDR